MKRADTLAAAGKAVADRGLNYGQPEDNFERIARRWNVCLRNIGYGVVDKHGTARRLLTGADVATMMIDVKLARLENDPSHANSWIDIAGYAACGGEVSKAGDRPAPGEIITFEKRPNETMSEAGQRAIREHRASALPQMQEQPRA